MRTRNLVWVAAIAVSSSLFAADPPPPALNLSVSSNGVKTVTWGPLVPALQVLRMLSGEDLTNIVADGSGLLSKNETGYVWQATNNLPRRFYKVEATHLSSNALFTYNLFNRIAYGPTPDEIERVLTGPNAIGPQAYLDEQLAFENVAVNDPLDTFVSVTTNAVPPAAQVNTNWSNVTVTGRATSSLLYMYLTAVGDAYIDDISLVLGTNANVGPNLIRNGDFESTFPGPWTVSANHASSGISTSFARSGSGSLRLVATTPGSTQDSSIWQTLVPAVQTNQMYTLSFWYLPRTNSSILTLRLSGSGIAASPGNEPGPPSWVYVTQTGTASSRHLYMYLSGSGDAYIDDIKLVAGSVPEAGPNLIRNGNFEAPLTPVDWYAATNATNSHISSTVSRNGDGSLRMVFSSGGSTFSSAIVQSNINVTMGATYTLSYWYVPSRNRTLTVRLSGNGINTVPDAAPSAVYRRLATTTDGASLSDLRSWFVNHAVGSKGQLIEILLQFLENHFVTQHAKSVDYLDRYYDDFNYMDRLAANMEFRENKHWREALLNPNCTFYDLLKIHAESPAEIIYLDTVDSRGDGSQIANENYARELFELFAMGVDNGYDQNDIVAMSRAWTGWSVDIVDHANEFNPFAPRSTTFMVSGSAARSNLFGIWTFNYKQANHGTNRAPILSIWASNSPPGNPIATGPKRVDARFGPPWAGTPYQLVIPRRTGTNGIQDGYDVIRHLADLPYTMEFISVKLCRLFVHDEFAHGVYDYTDPNRSAEAELVRQCLVAWNTPGPDGRKGNLRSILRTIFNSELFRSHGGSLQKVKTPLEFVASAVRALRSANTDGTFTAGTGDSSFNTQLNRMGAMSLFNRSDPDGYPETGPPWISAGTLAERLRFVQTLVMPSGRGDDAGNAVANPVALLQKKLPSAQWYDAAAVTDYFLGLLYPAEGLANLNQYRSAAINFLNTADTGTTADPLRAGMAAATYDTRIRGMVAMLMTFQRFQEQ